MQRNYRFSLNPEDKLESKLMVVNNKDLIHQITNVLRLRPGHKEGLSFIDGSGLVYEVKMISQGKKKIDFEIISTVASPRELKQQIRFFVPMIKKESFAFMIQKLTEIGVQEIVPVSFARSQRKNIEAFNKDKMLKIISEATEQCEGAVYTKLSDIIEFENLSYYTPYSSAYYASERLSLTAASQAVSLVNSDVVNLLVGPEGGLTDEEVEILDSLGFAATSLGPRLLKAETAAICLVSSIMTKP